MTLKKARGSERRKTILITKLAMNEEESANTIILSIHFPEFHRLPRQRETAALTIYDPDSCNNLIILKPNGPDEEFILPVPSAGFHCTMLCVYRSNIHDVQQAKKV